MENRKALRTKLIELGYDPKSGDWGIAWVDAMLGDIMKKLDEQSTLLVPLSREVHAGTGAKIPPFSMLIFDVRLIDFW